MLYRISHEGDCLRADLFHRRTADESREFFSAVAEAAQRHQSSGILISVHSSSPLFTVDRSGFFAEFGLLGAPDRRVALVADSEELRLSHEYFELLAQQGGFNVRHFRGEATALEWLRESQPARAQEGYVNHPDA